MKKWFFSLFAVVAMADSTAVQEHRHQIDNIADPIEQAVPKLERLERSLDTLNNRLERL